MKYSGVKWIGNIPSNWKVGKLYQYNRLTNGSTPSKNKEEYWENGIIPWMTSGEVNKKFIKSIDLKISKKGFENSSLEILPSGTVMMGLNGQGKTKGTVGILETETTCNQSLCGIIPNHKIHSKYLFYFLESQYKHLRGLVGEGKREGISVSFLSRYPLLIPELAVQKLISKYLDRKTQKIDFLIEKIEKKIELLKEQKTALITQCVTKGLNPNVEKKDSGVEWIGKIPSHWQLLRLNNLGRFSKGKGITKDKIKVNGNKCIRCGEIYTTYELRFNRTRSFIDDDTSDESVLATKGVLLFTGDGESLEEIGKCIVYEGEEDLYIGGGINVFTPKQEKVIPIYLSYVMNSESVIYQKSRQGKGEIVVHIYSKQLKEIRLGLPSIKEQQQIVEYLDQKTSLIDKIISYENKRLLFLKEYKKSLISEVVTGKKRVV